MGDTYVPLINSNPIRELVYHALPIHFACSIAYIGQLVAMFVVFTTSPVANETALAQPAWITLRSLSDHSQITLAAVNCKDDNKEHIVYDVLQEAVTTILFFTSYWDEHYNHIFISYCVTRSIVARERKISKHKTTEHFDQCGLSILMIA